MELIWSSVTSSLFLFSFFDGVRANREWGWGHYNSLSSFVATRKRSSSTTLLVVSNST